MIQVNAVTRAAAQRVHNEVVETAQYAMIMRRIPQKRLARAAGVSECHFSAILNGRCLVTLERAEAVLNAIGYRLAIVPVEVSE